MADKADHGGGMIGRFFQRSAVVEVDERSDVDAVTGLPRREELPGWVDAAVAKSNPSSARAVVAFIELGLLRDVNDSYGPDAGDDLLRQAAERLSSIDLPGTRAARYGGAEFAVVFEEVPHYEQAEEIARFLLDLLHEPFVIGEQQVTTTCTVGVALSADSHRTPAEAIRDAHQALIRAREEGHGSYVVIDDSRRGRYETRIDEARLLKALENEEFFLQYQPIVRLDTGALVGVEALLRWRAPGATNSGMLQPHDFMPLLEKSGLAVAVGEWVLNRACGQLAEWHRLDPDRPALFTTCNIGARQLAEKHIAETVLTAIRSSNVQPNQLCLDITEEALRYNRSSSWASLRDLKNAGVKLGLDDFGTGESSLLYLRELRLDLVRIDRVFVEGLRLAQSAGLGIDEVDGKIIRHIAALAHDLGLVTIAEGVESAAEAEALATHGIDMAQGFHFGRPLDPEAISATLAPGDDEPDTRWDPSRVLQGDE